jgi:arylsulfatase A-like enzyme
VRKITHTCRNVRRQGVFLPFASRPPSDKHLIKRRPTGRRRYANGGQIATPNFNEMHDRGIALTQYYVQPSCSPTRATLMTGRKPVHTGINFWIPNAAYGLPLNETTLAQVMNTRGFKSHAVGKVRVFSAD